MAAHCADRPAVSPNCEPSRAGLDKNAYVVGGATFVASLLNEGLIDELRLIVHPVVLGKGRGLFDGVNKRLSLGLKVRSLYGSRRYELPEQAKTHPTRSSLKGSRA